MYVLEVRGQSKETLWISVFTTVEKAAEWIKKYGRDWHLEKGEDYFFCAAEVIVDMEEEFSSNDEELRFFDKHGNELEYQPF